MCLAHEPISIYTIYIVVVLQWFNLQPNIRKQYTTIKWNPIVFLLISEQICVWSSNNAVLPTEN
jgi:hypothetical protein